MTALIIRLGSRLDACAVIAAKIGGVVLLALAAMTVLSVIGRGINAYGFGPIQGDFELVEHGMAFVVFCSLPYCQLRFGHVSVDVIARHFPYPLAWGLTVISQAGMAAMALVITRQLYLGLADKWQWGETTFIIQFPVWWGYAASLVPATLWALAAFVACVKMAVSYQPDKALP